MLHFLSFGLFFFFYWHYNPLWVLAFSVIFFHCVLSSHRFLQRLTPIICKSYFSLLGTIMNSVIQLRIHVLLSSTDSHYVNWPDKN